MRREKIRNNNIRMSDAVAAKMRAAAKADRKFIGAIWEEAASMYLDQRAAAADAALQLRRKSEAR